MCPWPTSHSTYPAEIHFQAVKHVMKYLIATRKDGIYYWHASPRQDLPKHPIRECETSLHGVLPSKVDRPTHMTIEMHAYVDLDWSICLRTRRSYMGIIVQMAGGTIAYKTKLQPTVALSSTEAEFMAACDAGKMVLFIRSILWDLGIPQQAAANVLYEDMNHVQQWHMLRNQPQGQDTWTLDTSCSLNGLKGT